MKKYKGYNKFYREIFEDRCIEDFDGSRYVKCEISGVRIYESEIRNHNFRHLLGKNVAPDRKFDPNNVQIVLFKYHQGDHISGEANDQLPIK